MPSGAKRRREDRDADQDNIALPTNGTAAGASGATLPVFAPKLPIPAGARAPSVNEMLDSLNPVQIRSILVATIADDATNCALSHLTDCWNQQLMKEQTRAIDFDYHSKNVWRTLNLTYKKLSGSKQYDVAGDAFDSVIGDIDEIKRQVTSVSSYGTKLSALETLRKIGKSVLLSHDCLGSEVRKQFGYDSHYADAMWHIVASMSEDERFKAGQNVSEAGKGTLSEKIDWVAREAKGCCVFNRLDEVVDLLNGEEEDEGGDEVDDEDDEQGGMNRSIITIDSD